MSSRSKDFRVRTCLFIATIHLMAASAPFLVSSAGIIAFLSLYYATLGIGITFGYHRMLAHHSFEAHRTIQWASLFLGALALQSGPRSWVEAHLRHHRHADHAGDPHSPHDGFLWSHVFWLFWGHPELAIHSVAPDSSPLSRISHLIERCFVHINVIIPLCCTTMLFVLIDFRTAISVLVWGFPLRIVAVWHATWLVNSATHRWGYRRYATKDDSRNNALVALLTFGEGWHNNHHRMSGLARHGHEWYELDATYLLIVALARLGLVWNVRGSQLEAQFSS